jgi:hypothetical protein
MKKVKKIIRGSALRQGATKSCGCYSESPRTIDETGNRYGKLLVVSKSPNRYHGYVCWFCKCECGNKIEVNGSALRQGKVKSCGYQPRRRKKKI